MPDQNGDCEIRFRIPAIISAQLREMSSLSGIGHQDLAKKLFYYGLYEVQSEEKRDFIIKCIKEGREVKW